MNTNEAQYAVIHCDYALNILAAFPLSLFYQRDVVRFVFGGLQIYV